MKLAAPEFRLWVPSASWAERERRLPAGAAVQWPEEKASTARQMLVAQPFLGLASLRLQRRPQDSWLSPK